MQLVNLHTDDTGSVLIRKYIDNCVNQKLMAWVSTYQQRIDNFIITYNKQD